MTTVTCGANSQEVEGTGKTIGDIRRNYTDVLNIPPDAQALVNGEEATDDHIIGGDEAIEFVKASGQKG